MSEFSITSKGQVTIPKAVRQQLGLRAGSKVRFRVVGDHAEIARIGPASVARTSGAGMLKYKGPPSAPDFDVASLLIPQRTRRVRKP